MSGVAASYRLDRAAGDEIGRIRWQFYGLDLLVCEGNNDECMRCLNEASQTAIDLGRALLIDRQSDELRLYLQPWLVTRRLP